MKLLGLDISSKSTGWFVSKSSKGLLITDPQKNLGKRLFDFRNQLITLLEKYKPTVVVIEDTYFLKNINTLKVLCMFQGVAREVCAGKGIKVEIMTASQARKYCCGKQESKFKKKEVFDYFVSKYSFLDFDFETHNDITDAAALFWGYREKEKLVKKKNVNKKSK